MFNTTFKIVYFVLFIAGASTRKYYMRKYFKQELEDIKKMGWEFLFIVIVGAAMALPLVYIFSTKLDFADYYLPEWIGWLGSAILVYAIWLLHRSHADLDRQFSITTSIQKNHKLITKGVYKHIRHPMYAAHILWAFAQAMILPNWIVGFSFLITFYPFYFYRVNKEEKIMIKEFGKEYKEYMKRTGRMIPKFNK